MALKKVRVWFLMQQDFEFDTDVGFAASRDPCGAMKSAAWTSVPEVAQQFLDAVQEVDAFPDEARDENENVVRIAQALPYSEPLRFRCVKGGRE